MGAKIKIGISVEKHEEADHRCDDLPLSGSPYTEDQIGWIGECVAEAIGCDDSIDDMFVAGFVAGMQFGVVPEGSETHGMTVCEFARNCYGHALMFSLDMKMARDFERIFGE